MLVAPRLAVRSPVEAEAVLEALVRSSVAQRRSGKVPPLSATRTRYRRDPEEQWRTARDTHVAGVGDCDQLAVWLAADLRARGLIARVRIRQIRRGLWHAVVACRDARGNWQHIDPSKARGMKGGG